MVTGRGAGSAAVVGSTVPCSHASPYTVTYSLQQNSHCPGQHKLFCAISQALYHTYIHTWRCSSSSELQGDSIMSCNQRSTSRADFLFPLPIHLYPSRSTSFAISELNLASAPGQVTTSAVPQYRSCRLPPGDIA
jgi:hypothetical protein